MRKTLALVAAGLLLSSAAFAATNYTLTMYPAPNGTTGTNWIALPGVPFNPDPVAVFGDVNLIDGTLSRLNPVTNNTETYYSFQEPGGPFGNMLLGDGYWINIGDGAQHTISFNGVDDGVPDGNLQPTDMWISLPGVGGGNGGYHWIGMPFNHPVPFANVKVTDGTQTLAVADAISQGWLDGYWAYMDAANQNTMNVDPDGIMGDTNLLPGNMYQVFTRKANLALIIPAS